MKLTDRPTPFIDGEYWNDTTGRQVVRAAHARLLEQQRDCAVEALKVIAERPWSAPTANLSWQANKALTEIKESEQC